MVASELGQSGFRQKPVGARLAWSVLRLAAVAVAVVVLGGAAAQVVAAGFGCFDFAVAAAVVSTVVVAVVAAASVLAVGASVAAAVAAAGPIRWGYPSGRSIAVR